MAPRRRRATVLAAVAVSALMVASGLTSCADGGVEQVNYAVDGILSSYNTNTVNGAASAGPQAFARVLTGFGLHGPDGQALADHDFGTVSVVGREPMVLDYQISDNAVYSDGKPVTCDDMVLAWAAQSGRFPGFDAASQAGYLDIAGIECQAGAKTARVNYFPNRGGADYAQLFRYSERGPGRGIPDRGRLEHHLEFHGRYRSHEVSVVWPLQDPVGITGRVDTAGRQRPVVGRQAINQPGDGMAARRRRPGPDQQR